MLRGDGGIKGWKTLKVAVCSSVERSRPARSGRLTTGHHERATEGNAALPHAGGSAQAAATLHFPFSGPDAPLTRWPVGACGKRRAFSNPRDGVLGEQ